MFMIRECDKLGNVLIPQTVEEEKALWKQCMGSCKWHACRVYFSQIIQDIYGDLYESFSDSDSKYESSRFVSPLVETR